MKKKRKVLRITGFDPPKWRPTNLTLSDGHQTVLGRRLAAAVGQQQHGRHAELEGGLGQAAQQQADAAHQRPQAGRVQSEARRPHQQPQRPPAAVGQAAGEAVGLELDGLVQQRLGQALERRHVVGRAL